MVIDKSALVAIALGEPSASGLRTAMNDAGTRALCSVSPLEAGIVLRAPRGTRVGANLYDLVEEIGCQIVHLTKRNREIAFAAFGSFRTFTPANRRRLVSLP